MKYIDIYTYYYILILYSRHQAVIASGKQPARTNSPRAPQRAPSEIYRDIHTSENSDIEITSLHQSKDHYASSLQQRECIEYRAFSQEDYMHRRDRILQSLPPQKAMPSSLLSLS